MPLVFLIMAGALGVSSFACGMIPLSASYSRKYLDIMNASSTGLLLGTALGVIIPEGVQVLASYYKDELESLAFYTSIDLIMGFLLMMMVEYLLAANHVHSHGPVFSNGGGTHLEFDAELGEIETEQNGRSERRIPSENSRRPMITQVVTVAKQRAISFTFGLVLHGIADGCALGVSALEEASSEDNNGLSLLVFLALLFHKAPTSVAFGVSLLNTDLPRADCRKYLAIFAASTPLGALATFFLLSFLGFADNTDLVGSALLISGGTFLYVATVLQPVSQHQSETHELKPKLRLLLIVAGAVTPLFLGGLIRHGH